MTRLEYQAYSKLAIKTLANIAENAMARSTDINKVPSLIRCAIHHRLGTVAVGEPSIGKANSPPSFTLC